MPQPPEDRAAPGLHNLRDVGGVPTSDGRRVLRGRLYRSDAPILGDPEPPLRPWPPRTVVDLRSAGEAAAERHPLASATTEVVNIPLMPQLDPARMAQRRAREPGDLPTIYRGMLRVSGEALARVVDVVAHRPGPVLLHCAAGKDRTGVATAVTLAAIGVCPEAIVADYLRTEERLEGLLDRIALGWSPAQLEASMHRLTVERPDLMRAPVEAVEAVLDTLAAWPGGAPGWLGDHGLAPGALETLRRELTEPAPAQEVAPAAARQDRE
jgi:protein-tyrosine phosphatase